MLNEPIPYHSYSNQSSGFFDDIEESLFASNLTHYASQLLEKGLHDEEELDEALKKAITALSSAMLPATRHFRKVFICQADQVRQDWLVSDLGLQLILLNADVANPMVGKLQVDILSAYW